MKSEMVVPLPKNVRKKYLTKSEYTTFLSFLREKTFPHGYTCNDTTKRYCNCLTLDYLCFLTSIFAEISGRVEKPYKSQKRSELCQMQCALTNQPYANYPSSLVPNGKIKTDETVYMDCALINQGWLVNVTQNRIYELYVVFCSKLESKYFGDDKIKKLVLCYFFELFSYDGEYKKNYFSKKLLKMGNKFKEILLVVDDTLYLSEAKKIFMDERVNCNTISNVKDEAYNCFLEILIACFDDTACKGTTTNWIRMQFQKFFKTRLSVSA